MLFVKHILIYDDVEFTVEPVNIYSASNCLIRFCTIHYMF